MLQQDPDVNTSLHFRDHMRRMRPIPARAVVRILDEVLGDGPLQVRLLRPAHKNMCAVSRLGTATAGKNAHQVELEYVVNGETIPGTLAGLLLIRSAGMDWAHDAAQICRILRDEDAMPNIQGCED